MKRVCIGGSYDRCIKCANLGHGCDGPRTSSMTTDRWCEFMYLLKRLRNVTNEEIADGTGVSLSTIARIMSGSYPNDMRRSTAGAIEDFLIGSRGGSPCAMDVAPPVYQDNPETLAKLDRLRKDKEQLQKTLENVQSSVSAEIATVREEMQRRIDKLENEVEKKDARIEKLINKLTE